MLGPIESTVKKIRRGVSRSEWFIRLFQLERIEQATEKGAAHPQRLVMVQVDGLSQRQLQRAIDSGEMPFLKRLLNKENYSIKPMYSGLPSSTPGVQGELFYGVKGVVPAFGFRNSEDGSLNKMYDPLVSRRVQSRLEQEGEGLLTGGSAYCNIYTGGAKEAHFCAASMGWSDILKGIKRRNWLILLILNLPSLVRTIALMIIEFCVAIIDVIRGLLDGKAFFPELKFIVARVGVSVLMRDLVTISASMDIARGLPIIQLNYLGYDEQSHRRGPDSTFAHWTLKGIDRAIHNLWKVIHRYPLRHYELWIYSDHGQEKTIPYKIRSGQSLEQAVSTALHEIDAGNTDKPTEVAYVEAGRVKRGSLGDLRNNKIPTDNRIKSVTLDTPAIAAMGPVGHLYFDHQLNSDQQQALAEQLVHKHQLPCAIVASETGTILAVTTKGSFQLPQQITEVVGADHPFLSVIGEDLVRLCRHKDAGDIVLLGCVDGATAVSFPMENGSHAGAGPNETNAFIMVPEDTELVTTGVIRPRNIYDAARSLLSPDPENQTLERDTGNTAKNSAVTETLKATTPAQIKPATSNYARNHATPIVSAPLRVMTYNVHSCIGMDNLVSPERVAKVIARCNPDVIALQELDVSKDRSHHVHQAKRIAEILDMEYHYHPAILVENEMYGDAILSRMPMRLVKSAALPEATGLKKTETRGAIWVEIDYAGSKIQLINTHLGLRLQERKTQIDELLSERWLGNEKCAESVIFCGDLNATPGSRTIKKLESTMTDAQISLDRPAKTFTSRIPVLRIDHIFTSSDLKTTSVQVSDSELARVSSDHLPLIAEITFQ